MYDKNFLSAQPPMKKEWFTFWNDKALQLVQQGTPRNLLEGKIKCLWSYEGGRQKALCLFGETLLKKYNCTNIFETYENSADKKLGILKELKSQKTQVEDEFIRRVHRGTISTNDKVAHRNHIKKLEIDIDLHEKEYSKILTNWTAFINKTDKNGPEKKKPGRKRKTADNFLTAEELKKKRKVNTDASVNESAGNDDSAGDVEMLPVCLSEDSVNEAFENVQQIEDPSVASSPIVKDTIDEVRKLPVQQLVKEPKLPVEQNTFLGIKLTFPGVCQNTINLEEGKHHGSNACTGISLTLAEAFKDGKFNIQDRKSVYNQYKNALESEVTKFREKNLGPVDVRSLLNSDYPEMKVKSETFWHTELNIGGKDPLEVCSKEYKEAVASNEKEALVFTLAPDKTFALFCDEEGNQALIDSHVHYTDPTFSFETAVKRKDLRGVIALCSKESNMLMYIFVHVATELKAKTNTGCMYRLSLN